MNQKTKVITVLLDQLEYDLVCEYTAINKMKKGTYLKEVLEIGLDKLSDFDTEKYIILKFKVNLHEKNKRYIPIRITNLNYYKIRNISNLTDISICKLAGYIVSSSLTKIKDSSGSGCRARCPDRKD